MGGSCLKGTEGHLYKMKKLREWTVVGAQQGAAEGLT